MRNNVSESSALEEFLGKPVKVFLATRNIALRGYLVGHDDTTLVLEDEVGHTVVYKAQVVSITENADDK